METARNIVICTEYISQHLTQGNVLEILTSGSGKSKEQANHLSSSVSWKEKVFAIYIVTMCLLVAEFFVLPIIQITAASEEPVSKKILLLSGEGTGSAKFQASEMVHYSYSR